MHSSDEEEEDFLSADEDGFDEGQVECGKATSESEKSQSRPPLTSTGNSSNEKVIEQAETEATSVANNLTDEVIASKNSPNDAKDDVSTQSITQDDKERNSDEPPTEGVKNLEEEDDDDEEALAERIRERNLKIARKFSAEIAKNVKASAPIPVKTSSQTNRDTDYQNVPGTPSGKSSFLPPAPPPTPALSSSFTNLNDQAVHQVANVDTAMAAATTTSRTAQTSSSSTQYSWRVPPTASTTNSTTILGRQTASGSSSPSTSAKSEAQARQVLDRLAEKLSHTDKNLFERVAADIKKVSIINEEVPEASSAAGLQQPLSSITDLGSALGGWGWSGATKLLSSASQVTSHVGSVFDSVSQHLQPTEGISHKDENPGAPNGREKETSSSDLSERSRKEQKNADKALPGDPLVDFTLNAMESLGKRAFGVMTTRDESGSLQIKGLGRPWEHLLNSKKINELGRDEIAQSERDASDQPELDVPETCVSTLERKHEDDKPQLPPSLKNRRRRQDNDWD